MSFDALTVPPGLNARTLEAIERERAREAAASQRVQDVEIACAQAPAPQASPAERVECGPMGGEADGRRAGAATRKRGRMVAWKRTAWALAACLALAAVGFGGYRWYAEPTAFVSLDVNPSIELEVNRFDTVVAARGVNETGVRCWKACRWWERATMPPWTGSRPARRRFLRVDRLLYRDKHRVR